MDENLTIGAVATLTNMPAKTIRFYEAEGLLPPAERTKAGYRRYTQTDVRRIRLMRRAKMLGLSLHEIKEVAELAFDVSCEGFEERLLLLVDQRLADVQQSMEELKGLQEELTRVRATLATRDGGAEPCCASECEQCRFIDD
jgi:DNA-binding transcriptional MerR regulator